MQKDYLAIYGNQLLDSEGHLVGMLLDTVFEKETGKILAYEILARGGAKRYLLPQDIRTWIADKILVQNEDALEDLENLFRVQEGVLLPKTTVLNQAGENLGEVINYSIDHRTSTLTQIEFAEKFLWFFHRNARLAPKKRIKKMTGEEIIIEDDVRDLALNLAQINN